MNLGVVFMNSFALLTMFVGAVSYLLTGIIFIYFLSYMLVNISLYLCGFVEVVVLAVENR